MALHPYTVLGIFDYSEIELIDNAYYAQLGWLSQNFSGQRLIDELDILNNVKSSASMLTCLRKALDVISIKIDSLENDILKTNNTEIITNKDQKFQKLITLRNALTKIKNTISTNDNLSESDLTSQIKKLKAAFSNAKMGISDHSSSFTKFINSLILFFFKMDIKPKNTETLDKVVASEEIAFRFR
jgi:hypothetical protein